MQTRIIDEEDIDPRLDQAIRDLLVLCFPHRREVFSAARRWRGNVPLYSVVVQDHDVLCANVAVVDRTIRVADRLLRVAGVALVAVAPAFRGRRLIDGALVAAMKEAAARKFDCGFLFTHRPTNRIYARNGWIEIAVQTTRIEDSQEIQMPPENVRMFHPLTMKDFPPGDIHLLGDKW